MQQAVDRWRRDRQGMGLLLGEQQGWWGTCPPDLRLRTVFHSCNPFWSVALLAGSPFACAVALWLTLGVDSQNSRQVLSADLAFVHTHKMSTRARTSDSCLDPLSQQQASSIPGAFCDGSSWLHLVCKPQTIGELNRVYQNLVKLATPFCFDCCASQILHPYQCSAWQTIVWEIKGSDEPKKALRSLAWGDTGFGASFGLKTKNCGT